MEPDGPRLPLLVTTVAHGVRLVGGQESGMVQAFFCRVLFLRRNHRPVLYLGAAPAAAHCRRINDFSPVGNCVHWQLLLFQSADDSAVLIAY